MDGHEIRKRCLSANALKQHSRSGTAHLVKRLPDGGQARIVEGGALDVVEAHDGDVSGNLEAVVQQGANGADGSNVVVTNEGGKIAATLNEFIRRLEPKLGCRDTQLKLHGEFRRSDELQIAGHGHEAIPAVIGVGAVAAAAHKCNFAVTELVKMPQGELGGSLLIENDVGYAFDLPMPGDSDRRQGADALFKSGVDEDESFDRAIKEQARIFFD